MLLLILGLVLFLGIHSVRIVADGAPTEIKATVGGRIVRATLPGVASPDRRTVRSRGLLAEEGQAKMRVTK